MCQLSDRIMDVRKDFVKAVSMRWAADGVVIPTNLMRGVFVTSAVENLDESGRYEFHGTAMTLTGHPTQDNMGEDPPPLDYNVPEGTSVELPVDFEFVPYLNECAGDITLSLSGIETIQPSFPDDYINAVNDGARLKHMHKVLAGKQGELQDIPMTCSGFFARVAIMLDQGPVWVFFLLLLFLRKSSINGNAKTCNVYVKKATSFVNPVQIPVIVVDCPLYAIQKKCQRRYPQEVGESEMVCMMGFLHIEMASQECGGSLLAGSVWDRMFTQPKIVTPGVSASLLGGKHVTRTRYAYQLTLAWLHMLKLQAYAEHCQLIWGPHETMDM